MITHKTRTGRRLTDTTIPYEATIERLTNRERGKRYADDRRTFRAGILRHERQASTEEE